MANMFALEMETPLDHGEQDPHRRADASFWRQAFAQQSAVARRWRKSFAGLLAVAGLLVAVGVVTQWKAHDIGKNGDEEVKPPKKDPKFDAAAEVEKMFGTWRYNSQNQFTISRASSGALQCEWDESGNNPLVAELGWTGEFWEGNWTLPDEANIEETIRLLRVSTTIVSNFKKPAGHGETYWGPPLPALRVDPEPAADVGLRQQMIGTWEYGIFGRATEYTVSRAPSDALLFEEAYQEHGHVAREGGFVTGELKFKQEGKYWEGDLTSLTGNTESEGEPGGTIRLRLSTAIVFNLRRKGWYENNLERKAVIVDP